MIDILTNTVKKMFLFLVSLLESMIYTGPRDNLYWSHGSEIRENANIWEWKIAPVIIDDLRRLELAEEIIYNLHLHSVFVPSVEFCQHFFF